MNKINQQIDKDCIESTEDSSAIDAQETLTANVAAQEAAAVFTHAANIAAKNSDVDESNMATQNMIANEQVAEQLVESAAENMSRDVKIVDADIEAGIEISPFDAEPKNSNQPFSHANPPQIKGKLRAFALRMPQIIRKCSGIIIFGRRIKSLVFSTDLAIIRNIDADAVLGVYPFTAQPIITQALLNCSDIPVLIGVGGGLTTGQRAVNLAVFSEMQGATGVILNAPSSPDTIAATVANVDIPVVVTVTRMCDQVHEQIRAGASILNVAAGKNTTDVVRELRQLYPDMPIMASGGPTDDSIEETIKAGANAITWTPPSNKQVFSNIMANYREGAGHPEY